MQGILKVFCFARSMLEIRPLVLRYGVVRVVRDGCRVIVCHDLDGRRQGAGPPGHLLQAGIPQRDSCGSQGCPPAPGDVGRGTGEIDPARDPYTAAHSARISRW